MGKVTIAELTAQNEQLSAKIKELESEHGKDSLVAELQTKNADLEADKKSLTSVIAEKDSQISNLTDEVKSLKEVNAELSEDNSKASDSTSGVFEVKKKKYKLIAKKFYIGTNLIEEKDLKSNPELLEKAIELKFVEEA